MFSPLRFRQEDEDIKLMPCNNNPVNPKLTGRLAIKMREEETELGPVTRSWGWLNLLSPYLAPGGKPVALILAIGLAAITISSVPGWGQIILSLSVLIATVSE